MNTGGGRIAARLLEGPMLLDGAMGTELMRRGLAPGAPPESWVLTRPHAVFGIHTAYAEAGADALYTCTFGANRLTLSPHGLGDRQEAIIAKAVELAQMAAKPRRLAVLGDIGPIGQMLEPYGDLAPAHARAAFTEQARALVRAGVDGIVVESFVDPGEALLAVAAARDAGAAFIAASMSFEGPGRHFRTMMGVSPEEAAEALVAAGAHAVGLNCGGDLPAMPEVVRRMAAAVPGTPILAKPNAGLPSRVRVGGPAPEGPDAFAVIGRDLAGFGATLVGGCCGTTPEHLASLRRALAAVPAR